MSACLSASETALIEGDSVPQRGLFLSIYMLYICYIYVLYIDRCLADVAALIEGDSVPQRGLQRVVVQRQFFVWQVE
jgi:hypothetical protein